jgi:hypothetical protein
MGARRPGAVAEQFLVARGEWGDEGICGNACAVRGWCREQNACKDLVADSTAWRRSQKRNGGSFFTLRKGSLAPLVKHGLRRPGIGRMGDSAFSFQFCRSMSSLIAMR